MSTVIRWFMHSSVQQSLFLKSHNRASMTILIPRLHSPALFCTVENKLPAYYFPQCKKKLGSGVEPGNEAKHDHTSELLGLGRKWLYNRPQRVWSADRMTSPVGSLSTALALLPAGTMLFRRTLRWTTFPFLSRWCDA